MNTASAILQPRLPALDRVPHVDQVGVEERVARICTRSIKKDSKVKALKLALSMIDLTTLEGQDTRGKVTQSRGAALIADDARRRSRRL